MARRSTSSPGRGAHLPLGALGGVGAVTSRGNALRAAVSPQVQAHECWSAVERGLAWPVLTTLGARSLGLGFAHGCPTAGAFRIGARLTEVGSCIELEATITDRHARVERRHAFAIAIAVGIAARHAERQAIGVALARSGKASAEPLIVIELPTRIAVRAIGMTIARHTSIDARSSFAREAGHTIDRGVAPRRSPQATADREIAGVVGIAAIAVIITGTASDRETAFDILAARGQANLPGGAQVIANRGFVGAGRTKRRGRALGSAAVWAPIGARIWARVGAGIGASVGASVVSAIGEYHPGVVHDASVSTGVCGQNPLGPTACDVGAESKQQ